VAIRNIVPREAFDLCADNRAEPRELQHEHRRKKCSICGLSHDPGCRRGALSNRRNGARNHGAVQHDHNHARTPVDDDSRNDAATDGHDAEREHLRTANRHDGIGHDAERQHLHPIVFVIDDARIVGAAIAKRLPDGVGDQRLHWQFAGHDAASYEHAAADDDLSERSSPACGIDDLSLRRNRFQPALFLGRTT
jgi:hypothetical protein